MSRHCHKQRLYAAHLPKYRGILSENCISAVDKSDSTLCNLRQLHFRVGFQRIGRLGVGFPSFFFISILSSSAFANFYIQRSTPMLSASTTANKPGENPTTVRDTKSPLAINPFSLFPKSKFSFSNSFLLLLITVSTVPEALFVLVSEALKKNHFKKTLLSSLTTSYLLT